MRTACSPGIERNFTDFHCTVYGLFFLDFCIFMSGGRPTKVSSEACSSNDDALDETEGEAFFLIDSARNR